MKAWTRGWKAAKKADMERRGAQLAAHQKRLEDARQQAKATRAKDPRFVLPRGEDLPEVFSRPAPVPCPKCRRILLDSTAQAVVVKEYSLSRDTVFLRCRNVDCRYNFAMPAKVAKPEAEE